MILEAVKIYTLEGEAKEWKIEDVTMETYFLENKSSGREKCFRKKSRTLNIIRQIAGLFSGHTFVRMPYAAADNPWIQKIMVIIMIIILSLKTSKSGRNL